MNPTRWWWRLGLGVALFTGLEIGLTLVKVEPDALRLGLLVALGFAVLGLVLDSLADTGPSWEVDPRRPVSLHGQDPRLARYLSILEGHVTTASPNAALRDRLAVLADLVLRQRHGLGVHDPGAIEWMGAELSGVLRGPPRRLSRTEIDRFLTRIEEL